MSLARPVSLPRLARLTVKAFCDLSNFESCSFRALSIKAARPVRGRGALAASSAAFTISSAMEAALGNEAGCVVAVGVLGADAFGAGLASICSKA